MKTNKWAKFLTNNTVVPILVVILIIAAVLDSRFMTPGNLLNVFNQNSIKGIMAIGMTFVIINGYFDMSLCTLVSLTAGLSCGLQDQIGLAGAILVALLVGLLVGGVNFSDLKWVLKDAVTERGEVVSPEVAINYGNFIQVTFDFLIIALAVFFLVKGISVLSKKKETQKPAPPAPPADIQLLTEIRDLLKENKG